MTNLTDGVIATKAIDLISKNTGKKTRKIDYILFQKYRIAVYGKLVENHENNKFFVNNFLTDLKYDNDYYEFDKNFIIEKHNNKFFLSISDGEDIMSLREWYLGLITREELDILCDPEVVSCLGINDSCKKRVRK